MTPDALRYRDFWALANRAAEKPGETTPILADWLDDHDSPLRAHLLRHGVTQHASHDRGPEYPILGYMGMPFPQSPNQPRVILGDEGRTIRTLEAGPRSSGLPDEPLAHTQVGPETYELFHTTALHAPDAPRRYVVRYTLRLPNRKHLRVIAPVTTEHIRALGEALPDTGFGHTWEHVAKRAERTGHEDKAVPLARPPALTEHDMLLNAAHQGLNAHPNADATALAAFADHLDESGRPGGQLAREGAAGHVLRGRSRPLQIQFNPDWTGVNLGGGIHVYPETDQDDKHWLSVGHMADAPDRTPLHYHVPVRDWEHLLSLVPDDAARRTLVNQMQHLGTRGAPADHLARMEAPAGGAIVNKQYHKSGFLPRVFKSIREVADRLRATPLARPEDATYNQLTQSIHENPHDATAHAAFGDFLAEHGIPGAAIVQAHALHPDLATVGRPRSRIEAAAGGTHSAHGAVSLSDTPLSTWGPGAIQGRFEDTGDAPWAQVTPGLRGFPGVSLAVLHHNPHGARLIHTAHANTADELRALIADFPPEAKRALLGPLVANGSLKRHLSGKGSRSFKLARGEAAGTAASVPVSERLTLGGLKRLEESHGLPANARLSPHAEQAEGATGDEHPYTANVEHIGRFVDSLVKHRLPDAKFRKVLQDDKALPVEKLAHLVTHLSHDAGQAEKIGWYGEHLNTLDKALHHKYGWGKLIPSGELEGKHDPATHHPELVLFKALVAATSASQNPVDNLSSALKAWDAGAAAGDPILHAPHYNTPALRKFLEALPPGAESTAGATPVENAKWYAKYVHGVHPTGEGVTPYSARKGTVVFTKDTTDPRHGLLLSHEANGKIIKNPDAKGVRLPAGATVKRVDLPIVQNGQIKAKGWARYGAQAAGGITKLQNLVRSFSGKDKTQKQAYTEAAQWLLSEHTPAEFDARMKAAGMPKSVNSGRIYSDGFLDKSSREPIPGTFIFGPKFGAFTLNLHANDPGTREARGKYLTADKWWTRTFHRYLGKLFDKGKINESPSARTRGTMRTVADKVAKRLGITQAELQADLWYYEQNLYRMLGAKSAESYSYADAAKKLIPEAQNAHQ